MKTFMLFLVFAVTDPEGFMLDEKFHVMAKRFEERVECETFVSDWEAMIRSRGMSAAQDLIKDDYTIELLEIGCVEQK